MNDDKYERLKMINRTKKKKKLIIYTNSLCQVFVDIGFEDDFNLQVSNPVVICFTGSSWTETLFMEILFDFKRKKISSLQSLFHYISKF